MNLVKVTLSLRATLLAIALAAPSPIQSAETATVSQQDVQHKLVYCKTFHGLGAEGYRGSIPMPRLAGQQSEYLVNYKLLSMGGGRISLCLMSRRS
jgi:cytochrome c553